jgi:RNA polymerase sigma-B factor
LPRLGVFDSGLGSARSPRGQPNSRTDWGSKVPTKTSEYGDVPAMFRRLKSLDPESVAFKRQREAIIERTLPLADHIARRFRNRGEPLEDLVQVARVGLINAVNRFDVESGADFLAFAVPTVMGEVRRHFRDYGWSLKVPRRLKDLQAHLTRAREELVQQTGRAPTATEFANHLGIDRELVVEAIIASNNYETTSIDAHVGPTDSGQTIGETVGDVDPNLDKVVDAESVRPLIAALPALLRRVLVLRFFEDMSQTQIAQEIGCSQMQVSRLLAQALGTLRRLAAEPDLAVAV